MRTVYEVKGMTCGHCVEAVTNAMKTLPGVRDVAVDLEAGRVEVTGEPSPTTEAVRAAVEDAGFELVG